MSVIVRGMEMPKCCDVCQFSDWSNLHQTAMCKIYDYEPCFKDFSREYTTKRSNNCPLVELPEKHGDLIDRKVLSNSVLKWLPPDPCGDEYKERPFETDICVSMLMEIEEQDVVIEAEGDG